MKTTKLVLVLSLVALATTACGQLSNIKKILFHGNKDNVEYIYIKHGEEKSRLEGWMYDLHSWAVDRVSSEARETPVITKTLYADNVVINYEKPLDMEDWMTAPFESSVSGEAMEVETWMTAPFETSLNEEALEVKSWMTAPFEANLNEEALELESWMTAPFESGVSEEVLEIEAWMTAPFNAGEVIEQTEWTVSARR